MEEVLFNISGSSRNMGGNLVGIAPLAPLPCSAYTLYTRFLHRSLCFDAVCRGLIHFEIYVLCFGRVTGVAHLYFRQPKSAVLSHHTSAFDQEAGMRMCEVFELLAPTRACCLLLVFRVVKNLGRRVAVAGVREW